MRTYEDFEIHTEQELINAAAMLRKIAVNLAGIMNTKQREKEIWKVVQSLDKLCIEHLDMDDRLEANAANVVKIK